MAITGWDTGGWGRGGSVSHWNRRRFGTCCEFPYNTCCGTWPMWLGTTHKTLKDMATTGWDTGGKGAYPTGIAGDLAHVAICFTTVAVGHGQCGSGQRTNPCGIWQPRPGIRGRGAYPIGIAGDLAHVAKSHNNCCGTWPARFGIMHVAFAMLETLLMPLDRSQRKTCKRKRGGHRTERSAEFPTVAGCGEHTLEHGGWEGWWKEGVGGREGGKGEKQLESQTMGNT